jgi:hypothetical protein
MVGTFTIALPTSLTGFAPDLTVTSASVDWREVIEGEDGPRRDYVIRVPDFIFDVTRRVNDETAYRINSDGTLSCADGPPEPGCIAIVLESPHKDEFDGQGGRALGPLRSPAVRLQMQKHLPHLIATVQQRLGRPLVGRSIALVNAVQYQASLHAIMRDFKGKLRGGVRTLIWKRIFREGGAAEFDVRLNGYNPYVVLLATTGVVRSNVRTLIASETRRWSWGEVNYHPSYWGRSAPQLRGQFRRGSSSEPRQYPSWPPA